TGTGEGSRHGPLLAVILWRGAPGWEEVRDADRSRIDSVLRWAQLRASEAHLSLFGSGQAYGLLADDYRDVIIEGQHFPLKASDSALVVMVTLPPNDRPRGVTTARIQVTSLPEAFWTRSWMSGDTTFFVRPSYPRDAAMLRQALVTS